MRTNTCDECDSPMRIASTMNSGNSRYETWQCTMCQGRKTVCVGLVKQ